MGRRAHGDTRKRINLYIQEQLITELQIFFFDPARGKPQYGALSDLVNTLLKEKLDEMKKAAAEKQSA